MPRKSKKQRIKDIQKEIDSLKETRESKKVEILDLITKKVTDIEKLRAGWDFNIDNWYKHYNGQYVKKYYTGSARVFVNATFEAVEVIKTIIMELLFPKGEIPFNVKPVEEGDAEKARDIWRPLLGFQAEKRINLEEKVEQALYNWIITGTIVVKTPYTYNTKWIKKGGGLRNLPTDDYPDFVPWDLRKVYFDPNAKRVEDLDMVVFESKTTLDRIKRNDKKYNPKGLYEDTDKLKELEHQSRQEGGNKYKSHIPEVKLWETFLNYDLDDDGIAEEIVCVIANGKVVLRLGANPYEIKEKPILIAPFFPNKNRLIGKGVPESIFEMQVQLNDAANQTLDDGTHILNRMAAFDCTRIDRASARIHLKSRPDGLVPVKHGDPKTAIAWMDVPNIMNEGLLMIKLLRDWMRSISGAEYSLQGLPGAYKPTATEYAGQQNVALARIKRYAKKFERLIIKPFLRKAYEYDMQFMSRKEFMKILGEKGAKYEGKSLKNLRIDCDFIPVGTSEMENKTARLQQAMTFYNLISKQPLPVILQLMRINLAGVGEQIAERLGMEKDRTFYEDPTPEMISPEDENELLKDGHKRSPQIGDNHLRHMIVHARVKEAREHLKEHQQMMMYIEQMAQKASSGVPSQEMPKGTSRANIGQMEGTAARPSEQF